MVSLKTAAKNFGAFVSRSLSAKPQPTGDKSRRKVLPPVISSVSMTKLDIKTFKAAEALTQGEDPKNYALQLILDETKRDALLTSQINNRKQQAFSVNFSLKKPNGEIDVEQTNKLKKMPLYRFLTHAMLDTTYHDYSMVELKFVNDVMGKTMLIGDSLPRTNVVPQTGMFYPDYTNDAVKVNYRDMPEYGIWLLEYKSQDGALLNKAVPHVIFKRFAQSCWAELCEIYGIPPRWIKTNTQDPDMLARAEAMMRDMGSAAWAVIDSDEEFEFAEGVTTNGDVYSNLINLCSNELSLLIVGVILGQDTKNGNRSKDEANQELLWYLVQSDLAMLEEYWNTVNIPALQKHGILTGDLTFSFDEAEDLNKLFDMVVKLIELGYVVAAKWLADKFGIPVEEAEKVVEDKQKETETDPEPEKPKKKDKPVKEKTKKQDLFAGSTGFFG
ncbi:hypothetical protein DBR40_09130 [Pedobacter sp. KBW01]|uniref:phage portal protein family protein n=1 Tax=Pedobacter sp. KBW01 TaxID=2153364 RepID=UPI000F59BC07|nr:DUF935 family protein [Pedobacter sp. KBW01]RQO78102.1 hypothetical protein DBR40_09130 [Pedobacter sp. KBW01]